MKKFTTIIIVLTISIIALGVLLISKGSSSKPTTYPLPPNLTYYWGNGCPHCKIVEDFLSSWEKNLPAGRQGLVIDKKEVWSSVANANELKARYEYCKVPQSEMGVPLLFTPDGKCFSGDTEIINYFKTFK